jgi:putative FmdB family regulatory protein
MARYDYICTECNHTFEINKPMKDSDKPENCPKCSASAKRVYLKPNYVRIK